VESFFGIVFYLVGFAINVAFAIYGSRMADEKGYSKLMGGLLGWFCGLFGLLILYLLPNKYAQMSSFDTVPNPAWQNPGPQGQAQWPSYGQPHQWQPQRQSEWQPRSQPPRQQYPQQYPPQQLPQVSPPQLGEAKYRIASNGLDLGDMSVSTVQAMLKSGKLAGTDQYFDPATNVWKPIGEQEPPKEESKLLISPTAQVSGEMSIETVELLLETGKLTPQDTYFDREANEWRPLGDIVGKGA